MTGARPLAISAIVCADWGKEVSKRAAFVADVHECRVQWLGPVRWTFEEVLRHAEPWASRGSVLVTFDAPLGVPKSYLSALSRASRQSISNFLELLVATQQMPSFFDATSDPRDWRPERPFFAVPGGEGGRRSYEEVARPGSRWCADLALWRSTRSSSSAVFQLNRMSACRPASATTAGSGSKKAKPTTAGYDRGSGDA